MDILNVGAGNKPVKNAINHDLRLDPRRPWVTVAHDLNELPWPWEDNSFDLVVACSVLEHLRLNLLESIGECWRILRPGGELHIKLPYWKSEVSYNSPDHYWTFGLGVFDHFDPDTQTGKRYEFYMPRKWRIVQKAKLNDIKTSFSGRLQVRKE